MVFVQERKLKGIPYLYVNKTLRIKNTVFKISKYLGRKGEVSDAQIKKGMKDFALDVDRKTHALVMKDIRKRYAHLEYTLDLSEVEKIEEMNIKYHEIRKSLHSKDWMDVKKRFVANFVFESNALEGNSLTLKNFSEIVFEDKVESSADLREVYDAKNSYMVFSDLFDSKRELTESAIINLHKKIMKNIDNRVGYKKVPNILLGRDLELTKPEHVEKEMKMLITWYQDNKDAMYPLELAFKFHHRFEKIHPFADGNGRIGRMLLNYILIKRGYFPIIIRKTVRERYLKALQAADLGTYVVLMRFALEKAKQTHRKFFEVYYHYL